MPRTLEELYPIVKSYVDRLDFSLLWEGFSPLKFALYNDLECYFDGRYIEKSEEFLANTSIRYQGETIAIWNVMEEMDPIVLASKIAHEMFHGFQMDHQESRFPDETEALVRYRYDDQNLSLKLEESKLLIQLSERFDQVGWERFLSLRKYRQTCFPYEYGYEAAVEQIEGTANYVELHALKQLSGAFYQEKLDHLRKRLLEKGNYLPIRVLCYDIGALLLTILKTNQIPFEAGFTDAPFSIDLLRNVKEAGVDVPSFFHNEIKSHYENAEKTIRLALEKNDLIVAGEQRLLGVNVYNAVFHNGHLISTFFVMYGDENAPHTEYGNFVIETHDGKTLTKIYRY